jgi:hypothetical protein
MNTHPANVLIHVDETVASGQTAAMEKLLGQIEGVIQVRPTDKPHLTQVEYDPEITRASTLLASVRSQGLHAQLIGM